MKKFSTGLLIGILIGLLTASTFAVANSPIKLIVNNKEIQCDVAPQVINGRTMVPARYVAEALGATVNWDAANNAVVVTGQKVGGTPEGLPSISPTTNPVQQSTANIGEVITFSNCQIKVIGIKYSNQFEEFTASDGETFALLELEVLPNKTKTTDTFLPATAFIQQWSLSNGQKPIGDMSTKNKLDLNTWNKAVIAKDIPNGIKVKSVTVCDNINRAETKTISFD